MKLVMPFCYHPTTIILVDDDAAFVNIMAAKLSDDFLCQAYHNVRDALLMSQNYVAQPFTSRCLDEDVDPQERDAFAAINSIHGEIYNAKRFNNISVMVVDYQMPAMNGLEFCQAVRQQHPEIKLIMLTGEAEEMLAIKAFNDKIIDQFIRKSHTDLFKIIKSTINVMQYEYFHHLSSSICSALMCGATSLSHCLQDIDFADFFQDFLQQHRISEYYLLQNKANFLLLDVDGNVNWLIIRDDEDMQAEIDVADDQYENSPTAQTQVIVENMRNHKQLPFFYSAEDYCKDINAWQPYMHPIKHVALAGKNYYYVFISGASIYSITQEKIASFRACQE
ncbi:MAG: response regulator [Gammaproteobacteria bacterium]|nr:response regulator [Gammaproteobacteria bacterium]